MVFLHLFRKKDQFWVWGESASETVDALSPFDLGEVRLREILKHGFWEREPPQVAPLSVPLPCMPDGVPIPSFPFFAESRGLPVVDLTKPVSLLPCLVTGILLPVRQLLEMVNLASDRHLAEGLFAGESLRLLSDFLRFAGALITRGRFLPGMKAVADGFISRWTPILDPADQRHLMSLAAVLPLLLRDQEAPEIAASEILAILTDAMVRHSVITTLSESQARRGRFYSAHDAWFAALRGSSAKILWPNEQELAALSREVDCWQYPVTWQAQAGHSLGFTLRLPARECDPWVLGVEICSPQKREAFPCDLTKKSVSGKWLLALGQAILLFPPLGCLEKDEEGNAVCVLSNDEAHLFFTSAGKRLEGAGYAVSIPGGADIRQRSVELIANVDDAVSTVGAGPAVNLNVELKVRWSVALDGESLTAEEVRTLMHAPSPLVFFRGKWVLVNLRKMQDALRAMNRKRGDALTAREIIRLALGVEGRNGLDVANVRSSGWIHDLLRQLEGTEPFQELPPPSGFHGTLRPYQIRGYSWLAFLRTWGFGACLADDMGLGKTIQTLAFLLHEREKGESRPVLLIAPTSVLGNWLRETERFAPSLRCFLHHGATRPRGGAFLQASRHVDLVLTSYALLYRDYGDLRRITWAGIIIDEAQNIKNPDTRQTRIARALQADYRIALTGTPMENHVGDIWSIIDFLNPEMLGGRASFRRRFFQPIQTGSDPFAKRTLRQMTAPFILRRLKTDRSIISDLPEKWEGKVYCPLTEEQMRLYQAETERFEQSLTETDGIQRKGLILSVLTHLKQICNHPSNYLRLPEAEARRSGKLTRLEEMLREVFERGESALVFSQYAEMGALLQRQLCQTFGDEMPFLHGGVPRKSRDRMVREFQESQRPLAFILSLKAGGIGLNLTRATHVFHFDRWWNPAVENQATDRAFRIGQSKRVAVHKFICSGTLEERIDQLIERKTALSEEIVGNGEQFLTELSNETLRNLVRLKEDLVVSEEPEATP